MSVCLGDASFQLGISMFPTRHHPSIHHPSGSSDTNHPSIHSTSDSQSHHGIVVGLWWIHRRHSDLLNSTKMTRWVTILKNDGISGFTDELKTQSCQTSTVVVPGQGKIQNAVKKDQYFYFTFSANATVGITFKVHSMGSRMTAWTEVCHSVYSKPLD